MSPPPPAEPTRPADDARLLLAKLRVEDGVSLDAVFRQATELAAGVLDVERAGVWLLVDDGRALRCVDLFERSKAAHSSGVTLQVRDFPEYFAALESRKTIPAEVAVTDPRTSCLVDAYLAPLGITSLLDAPIFVGGEVVGVVCHEHTGEPREWTTEQRDFAGSIADVLALKIRAAESEELRATVQAQALQLAESRRSGALAETAAGIAHDFNNILTVIVGFASHIAAKPTAASVAQSAQQIVEAGKRGAGMARELMEFARPGPASARVIRPAEVVAAQFPLLQGAAGERHPVQLDAGSPAGKVMIAPTQLERVLLNLVVNARDAMPDGGPIRVTVDTVADADDRGRRGTFVRVAVADGGTGIPDTALPRIFEPFFTTKPKGQGTGVGLAVVHQIVSYAGGFICVDTAPDQGTTFRVYLPCVSSA